MRQLAIQGSGDGLGYVKTFTVKSLKDGDGDETWKAYKEKGETKVFNANSDNTSVVTKTFNKIIRAQFLRILPTSTVSRTCLRVEVYGCPTSKWQLYR